MNNSSIKSIKKNGQEIWLDNLNRGLIKSGKFKNLVDQGITGFTTNPTIFFKCLEQGDSSKELDDYYQDIELFVGQEKDFFQQSTKYRYCPSLYDFLLLSDIKAAADLLMPMYLNSSGEEGYISVDLDPTFAYRSPNSIHQACWIWENVNRPNLMIKIPATLPGMDIIRALTYKGINVNVTCIFSLQQYELATQAYISGLQSRRKKNLPLNNIRSVASVCIGPFDFMIDTIIDKLEIDKSTFKDNNIRGFAGSSNAKIIYDMYGIIFEDKLFKECKDCGANKQKIVWTGTSIKDDAYSPLKYVNSLIGKETILSLTWDTMDALIKTSQKFTSTTIDKEVNIAYDFMDEWLTPALDSEGMDIDLISSQLLGESIEISCIMYDEIFHLLYKKMSNYMERKL